MTTASALTAKTRTRLNKNQIVGFWGAWAGWTLDGMDSVMYALVLAPGVTELLPKSGYTATPGNIGLVAPIPFAVVPTAWRLSLIWGPVSSRLAPTTVR